MVSAPGLSFGSGNPNTAGLDGVTVPAALARSWGPRGVRPVWRNLLGGLTFAVGGERPEVYVKWAPTGVALGYEAEARRLEWAAPFTPVPEVLELGADEDGSWLVLKAVDASSAVSGRWLAEPRTAVRAIGEGLASFHDAMPAHACPFGWEAEGRVAQAHQAARGERERPAGEAGKSWWQPRHRHLGVDEALRLVEQPPPVELRVVCHGDPCAPNTLIGEDGRWVAHVDMARMGTADRWADIAVATWSCDWNYGPGWQAELLAAYGVAPDEERMAYYRLLWDLT